jgi:hypothetical protein
MRNFKMISTGAGLSALMTVMVGCESAERIQTPSSPSQPTIGAVGTEDSSEFDRELIRAKVDKVDPARSDEAIMRVFDKYGITYTRPKSLETVLPVDAGMQSPSGDAVAAKSGATSRTSFNAVRRDFSATAGDIATFTDVVTLEPGHMVVCAALGKTASVDPFVVAYYPDPFGTPKLKHLKVVAFNDDVGSANRNSAIQWTNNTGVQRTVWIIAFAYSTATKGLGTVIVNTSTSAHTYVDQPIGGLKQWGATALPTVPKDCWFSKTEMRYRITSGDIYGPPFALIIDNQAMRGGYMSQFSNHFLDLPWQVNNPYPSFALIAGGTAGHTVRLTQTDMYNCVE